MDGQGVGDGKSQPLMELVAAASGDGGGGGTVRRLARRYLPDVALRTYRLAERGLALRLYRPAHLRLCLADYMGGAGEAVGAPGHTRSDCRKALVAWLTRAQDAVSGGGVAAYYGLAEGWSPAYPETTGYIIATCLEAARRMNDQGLAQRARRMADWEVGVQLPSGAWQSGVVTVPPVPAVFNTGQVIQGLLAAYLDFGDAEYVESALRGARWLMAVQDGDGAWRRHTYRGFPNTYSTRVAWPLVALASATGDRPLRQAAERYLTWASSCQDATGWLHHCHLEPDEPPLTHTLAYAAEGFIESGAILGQERWLEAGRRVADALLHRFEVRKALAGTYDRGWRGDYSFSCLTGCAQMARVWGRLYALRGDLRYLNAALKLSDFVSGLTDLRSPNPGIRGGVKGSQPIHGPYMTYRMPSWAVKFMLDALFQEEDALILFQDSTDDDRHPVRLSE